MTRDDRRSEGEGCTDRRQLTADNDRDGVHLVARAVGRAARAAGRQQAI
jgi:hypothetical protein